MPAVSATPTAVERTSPRPRREYAVPVAARNATWPFGPDVYRWQSLVEQQLRTIRATRRLDAQITIELVLAMIDVESRGDPLAVSHADAVGLMQVLPSTFAELMGDGDPFDPELNVRAGILYLNLALASHGGDVEWALAAYNAGIGASRRARAGDQDLWDETLDYVDAVLDRRDRAIRLRGSAPPPPPAPANIRESLRATIAALTATATGTATPTPTATPSVEGTAQAQRGVAPASSNPSPQAPGTPGGATTPQRPAESGQGTPSAGSPPNGGAPSNGPQSTAPAPASGTPAGTATRTPTPPAAPTATPATAAAATGTAQATLTATAPAISTAVRTASVTPTPTAR
jgi:hypothetical protein